MEDLNTSLTCPTAKLGHIWTATCGNKYGAIQAGSAKPSYQLDGKGQTIIGK